MASRFLLLLLSVLVHLALGSVAPVEHKSGTCSLYGNCGKKSLFGSQLPCPANIPAVDPDESVRASLVDICGAQFSDGPVCCTGEQVDSLRKNLKKVENIISSCPACKENFFNFFCKFTCSPDQSLFVNVTETGKSTSGLDIVTELDQFVDPISASRFYDSCKEVKFSATNGYAMDLIGGGAKDYKAFLKFLGDEKPLLGGSPFQINFPWDIDPSEGMIRSNVSMYGCSDEEFRCACSDCSSSCPELEPISGEGSCKVGRLPCLSFAVIMTYTGIMGGIISGYALYWYIYKRGLFGLGTVRLLDDDFANDNEVEDSSSPGYFGLFTYHSVFRESDRLNSSYKLNSFIQSWFAKVSKVCATFPRAIISISILLVVVLSLGIFNLKLETEPGKLWVSSDSREAKEKAFFDDSFGPFYRSQQVYLVNDTDGGQILADYETIKWWFDVEQNVSQIRASYQPSDASKEALDVTLDDICFKPTGEACVVESFTQYFSGSIYLLPEQSYKQKIASCADSPVNCLPPFQQPLKKELLFGGVENDNVLTAKALVVTWVINNGDEYSEEVAKALVWETALESYLKEVAEDAKERGLRLSFNTESSLEKELNKSSNTDAGIIALSYLFMFLYASLALGGVMPGLSRSSLVKTKFSLGLFGILVVLMSVSASVGVFATLNIKATLIIAEVIPFLVLAVGVDNIFLLTHELETVNISHPSESIEERISRAVGRIGPSILLSSSCEILAFSLGAAVSMPAVRNFAIYSAGAVFFNSVLQLTTFVSAMALDQQRVESNRVDCFPWIKSKKRSGVPPRESFSTLTARMLGSPRNFEKNSESAFSRLIRKYYAPQLLKNSIRPIVVAFFIGWTSISIALMPKIELGLDQRLAVPADSYLVDYFNDLYLYFNSGPPVYFVTYSKDDNFDVTSLEGQQQLCGRFSGCEEFSLVNILEQERKRPEVSFLADPPASWIDDFLQWLNPELDECCRFKKNTNQTELCAPNASPRACEVCYADKEWDTFMHGFPEGPEFIKYFGYWIESPSDPCPLGGKAPYSSSVDADYENNKIVASTFRTSHTRLQSQDDFIKAYAAARRIADSITKTTGVPVFPYSSFYIFFSQYSTIIRDSLFLVGGALSGVFVLSVLLLGSLRTSVVIVIVVAMVVTNVLGIMGIWGIGLNAVSLVNLVICVGLGVEFCIHVARMFTFTQKLNGSMELFGASRVERAFNALVGVGGSVFGGIALTKLIGVTVLAFTHSKIFEVYYFRMWAALVLVATTHSLVFLPVILSYIGGAGYIVDPGEQGVPEDLASRLYEPVYDNYINGEETETARIVNGRT